FYGVLENREKAAVAQRARDEAQSFSDLTRKLEAGREVAHADVVKADLSLQQRQREYSDAVLAADKARLDLGVLLFPDPRTPYTVTEPAPSTARSARGAVRRRAQHPRSAQRARSPA